MQRRPVEDGDAASSPLQLVHTLTRYLTQPDAVRWLRLENLGVHHVDLSGIVPLPNLEGLSLAGNQLAEPPTLVHAVDPPAKRCVTRARLADRSSLRTQRPSRGGAHGTPFPRLHVLDLSDNVLTPTVPLAAQGLLLLSVLDVRGNRELSPLSAGTLTAGLTAASVWIAPGDASFGDIDSALLPMQAAAQREEIRTAVRDSSLWVSAVDGVLASEPSATAVQTLRRGTSDLQRQRRSGTLPMTDVTARVLELAVAALRVAETHPQQRAKRAAEWRAETLQTLTRVHVAWRGAGGGCITTEGVGLSEAAVAWDADPLAHCSPAQLSVFAGISNCDASPRSKDAARLSVIGDSGMGHVLSRVREPLPQFVACYVDTVAPTADVAAASALLSRDGNARSGAQDHVKPSDVQHQENTAAAVSRNLLFSKLRAGSVGARRPDSRLSMRSPSPMGGLDSSYATVVSTHEAPPSCPRDHDAEPSGEAYGSVLSEPPEEQSELFHQALPGRPRLPLCVSVSQSRAALRTPGPAKARPRSSLASSLRLADALPVPIEATMPRVGDVIEQGDLHFAVTQVRSAAEIIARRPGGAGAAACSQVAFARGNLVSGRMEGSVVVWRAAAPKPRLTPARARTPDLTTYLRRSQVVPKVQSPLATPSHLPMGEDRSIATSPASPVQEVCVTVPSAPKSHLRLPATKEPRSWTHQEEGRLRALGSERAAELLAAADHAWAAATGGHPPDGMAFRCAAACHFGGIDVAGAVRQMTGPSASSPERSGGAPAHTADQAV